MTGMRFQRSHNYIPRCLTEVGWTTCWKPIGLSLLWFLTGLNTSRGFMPSFCTLRLHSPPPPTTPHPPFRTAEETFPCLKHMTILPSSRKAFSCVQGTSKGRDLCWSQSSRWIFPWKPQRWKTVDKKGDSKVRHDLQFQGIPLLPLDKWMTWLVSKRADVSLTTTQVFCGVSAAGRMPGCFVLPWSACGSVSGTVAGEGDTVHICSSIPLNKRKPQESR